MIGATTVAEYRAHIEKDAALERRFQSVMVGEPTPAEAEQILIGLRDRYEAHHRLKITDEAIHAAVSLSVRYIPDRYLPDKAIDLVDEAAAKVRIHAHTPPPEIRKSEEELKRLAKDKEEAILGQDFESAAALRDGERTLNHRLAEFRKTMEAQNAGEGLKVTAADIAEMTSYVHLPGGNTAFHVPDMARAAAFCLVPVAVTGGIHLDGYADTSDALSSYGDREKKLEILKDSHCGAFAVIRLCCYFVAYFGLCGSVRFTPRAGLCWTLALVLERALSGLAVASFPMAKNTGLAHTFATAADKTVVRRVLAVLAAVLCVGMAALGGWALVLAALAVLWRYHAVSWKQFGGITGDLAGWFLQKAELWMLAALCACQWGGLL